MSRNTNSDFKITAYTNTQKYNYYITRILGIANSIFTWEGLPSSVNLWSLERYLTMYGTCCIFKEPELEEFYVLPYTINGNLDINGLPNVVRAYSGYNGANYVLEKSERVILWGNNNHCIDYPFYQLFAYILSEIDAAIRVNVNAQKTPIVITCSKQQELTFKNLMMKYDGNVPVIYGSKDLDLKNAFQLINPDVPYRADALQKLKTDIWNECLSFIGVNNLSVVKKERMIKDEIQQMQGGSTISRLNKLIPRRVAAEELKEKFGLDVTVNYSEDILSGKEAEDWGDD